MFVGEIGYDRNTFLYVLRWWEVRAILKGYARRDRMSKELQRLTAYCAFYAMRENKSGLTPTQWLALPWEKEEDDEDLISEEEAEEYKRMLIAENERMKQEAAGGA